MVVVLAVVVLAIKEVCRAAVSIRRIDPRLQVLSVTRVLVVLTVFLCALLFMCIVPPIALPSLTPTSPCLVMSTFRLKAVALVATVNRPLQPCVGPTRSPIIVLLVIVLFIIVLIPRIPFTSDFDACSLLPSWCILLCSRCRVCCRLPADVALDVCR